jgi:hypothetical protein
MREQDIERLVAAAQDYTEAAYDARLRMVEHHTKAHAEEKMADQFEQYAWLCRQQIVELRKEQ